MVILRPRKQEIPKLTLTDLPDDLLYLVLKALVKTPYRDYGPGNLHQIVQLCAVNSRLRSFIVNCPGLWKSIVWSGGSVRDKESDILSIPAFSTLSENVIDNGFITFRIKSLHHFTSNILSSILSSFPNLRHLILHDLPCFKYKDVYDSLRQVQRKLKRGQKLMLESLDIDMAAGPDSQIEVTNLRSVLVKLTKNREFNIDISICPDCGHRRDELRKEDYEYASGLKRCEECREGFPWLCRSCVYSET